MPSTWFISHAIEPNFRQTEALAELYRVCARWLVLFEPSYELGSEATRKHIEEHGYCRNLAGAARELGLDVVEHRLLDFTHTSNNQTGVLVIRKPATESRTPPVQFGCPVCRSPLTSLRGHFFCPECLLVFPVLDGIPCLLPGNGILASKYPDLYSPLDSGALKVLGIIPARGGSKGIPGKNMASLAGKPLIAWAIEAAQLSTRLARLIVSTDDPAIAEVARRFGGEVPFLRPPELAGDASPVVDAVEHAPSRNPGMTDMTPSCSSSRRVRFARRRTSTGSSNWRQAAGRPP